MEGCLICLELNKDCIAINSSQWHELNIKSIIQKHLWPMSTILENYTRICTDCWQELSKFHEFYMRIEEAHISFGLIEKCVQARKESFDTKEEVPDLSVFNVESVKPMLKTLVPQLLIEEQIPLIKEELNEEQSIDEMPLIQRRKRGRHHNVRCNDPLKKSKNEKNSKKTKEITKLHLSPMEQSNDKETTGRLPIKEDPDSPTITDEQNISVDCVNNDNDDDTDSNIDSDKESSEIIETKSRFNLYYTPKTNRHEKDKFIAENFKIACILCQIPFETFQAMRKHFEVQHKQPGYVTCCNKKFYRRSILVDHVHRHLDPNYFKCSHCGKVMADRRCLELHVKVHEINQEKNHCCDICGKGFAKRTVLKTHKLTHLSEEEKRFPCSECGKNFASNYLLSNHYRAVHLKKYAKICDICGKSIRCKEVFERHMLEHQGKPTALISCDICGLLLAGKSGLKRHKDTIHPEGGKKEYTCPVCSKISPNLKAHKRHIQYKHELGYDHKCTICEKAFKRAQALTEHMTTHTGSVLYTCPWCPKTFNSNANLHNHRKKGHPKEWEEATRKKYSGNLPPKYKTTLIPDVSDYSTPLELLQ